MNPEVLEKVLSCKKLPTLPAVAMRVIELTNNNNVSMKALAETIQNDQALTAKVLRTVNSSLFGLRQKCSSINQAIVMLGLSAVKTLALGFTLVGAIKDATDGEFDLSDHWRRALYTAIAGKLVASAARLPNPEECFLGGLLQDVGMIALHQALGEEYLSVVRDAGIDHRAVVKIELERLQTQHPDVGAMLVHRWKLPDALVMPVKYHERPTAAPQEHSRTCRAVGLGNIAADILTSSDPAEHLRKFYKHAETWFGLSNPQADDVLKLITQQTREMASLLSVPTSGVADAAKVLTEARKQLAELVLPETGDSLAEQSEGADPESVDELTGAASRRRFDRTLVAAFEQARAGDSPLSVALFDVDDLEVISRDFGEDAGDTVLIAMAHRIAHAYAGVKPLVCRYGDRTFGVVMPKTDRLTAVRITEQARQLIARLPVKMLAGKIGTPAEIAVTMSVGLAALDRNLAERFDDPGMFTQIAERAVMAARKSGNNSMRVYAPTAKAA
jgi:diguanylate cyclase (GGDEF)-like protein